MHLPFENLSRIHIWGAAFTKSFVFKSGVFSRAAFDRIITLLKKNPHMLFFKTTSNLLTESESS